MPLPWESDGANGDTRAHLCRTLRDLLTGWLQSNAYASRLPPREHFPAFLLQDEKLRSGVNVRLLAVPDSEARPVVDFDAEAGRRTVRKAHLLQIVVKADEKGGGSPAVGQVFEALRDALLDERNALTGSGIYAFREVPSGTRLDDAKEDSPETTRQALSARCLTVSWLDPE